MVPSSLFYRITLHHVFFCTVIKVIWLRLYPTQIQLLLLFFAGETGAKEIDDGCAYSQTYDILPLCNRQSQDFYLWWTYTLSKEVLLLLY